MEKPEMKMTIFNGLVIVVDENHDVRAMPLDEIHGAVAVENIPLVRPTDAEKP